MDRYGRQRFSFDKGDLDNRNSTELPEQVDVMIVGAGITGLYAAHRLAREGLSFCVVEERDIAGGIWTKYANATSQVNTSEGAYRLLDKKIRANRDHSTTAEILRDLHQLFTEVSAHLYTRTRAERIEGGAGQYRVRVVRNNKAETSPAKASYSRSMIGSAAPVLSPGKISTCSGASSPRVFPMKHSMSSGGAKRSLLSVWVPLPSKTVVPPLKMAQST